MEPDPLDQFYRKPLLTNAVLLLFPSLSYWYMQTHMVSYGNGIFHPETEAALFFYATFGLFPLVNLLFFLRALLYSNANLAYVYGLLGGIFSLGFYVLWYSLITSFHKIGG